MTKKGYYLHFFIQEKNVHKTSQNWFVIVMFGLFRQHVCISDGGENPKKSAKSSILTPFWNKHISSKTTNHSKNTSIFASFMIIPPPLNWKYQNKTTFWSFLPFSLLSYIEIYVEYRETSSWVIYVSLRGVGWPHKGP